MIVPVNCGCGECPAWALVELQGELSLRHPADMTAEGFDVGVVCFRGKTDVSLTIGYHQLEGKLTKLKKPFVIMEKVVAGEDEGGALSYQVAGVIHDKILFKNRPKALISKPSGSTRL